MTRRSARIAVIMAIFAMAFGGVCARLIYLGFQPQSAGSIGVVPPSVARPDIVDRNGNILAMDLPSLSVYAEPRRIVDVDEALEALTAVFPDLDSRDVRERLSSDSGFAWVRRAVPAAQVRALWRKGIPGVGIREETRRTYPGGSAASHVLGFVNVDNAGIAGIEKWIDDQGLRELREAGFATDRAALNAVELTIDQRVQHAVADELRKAVTKFKAIAAAGLVLDVTNGEVLALVSLPDFDPNFSAEALMADRINRISVGTYEMGSTFKAMTTAMALDSGAFGLRSVIDASVPLRFGNMTIRDYRGQNRALTLPEAFVYSSNIAMGRMALDVGPERHRAYLGKLGQFDRLVTELPENAKPIVPAKWGELTTATAAFGHGIAVTPLQASMGVAALVNGGLLIRPTFIKGAPIGPRTISKGVVSEETGDALRFLMRLNAEVGSAKNANAPGYFVGGKTGTSEKVVGGRYSSERVLTAFMGIAPADTPRYLFLTLIDEPQGLTETYGFRTSGWNAAPVTREIMERSLPALGVLPSWDRPAFPFPLSVQSGAWGTDRFLPRSAKTDR